MSNPTAEAQVQATTKPDFGNGKYSQFCEDVYADAQTILHMSPKAAEKLARSMATEIGGYMANQAAVVKVGKTLSKSARVTISEASKLKGVMLTNNLAILRALDYIATAGKFSILWSATNWRFTTSVTEYIASVEESVKEPA